MILSTKDIELNWKKIWKILSSHSYSNREGSLNEFLDVKLKEMATTIFDRESMKFPLLAPEKLFIARIRDYHRITSTLYFDVRVEEAVKAVVPWKELTKSASEKISVSNERNLTSSVKLDAKDVFLVELLDWFKNSFFSWFDKSICSSATCPLRGVEMQGTGSGQPTAEDLSWGASRIELYACASCGSQERFPRYNHPLKLLETRRGRCGEWANIFTCICTVFGFDARLVLDWTDHVWTEIYCESQSRWIHVDSCEAAVDTPLVYESGWKKSLSYCIAISRYEIQDVTFRYSLKEPKELSSRRKECTDLWLASFILIVNSSLQLDLPIETKNKYTLRFIQEMIELLWTPWKENQVSLSEKNLQGRQSGSKEWRRMRNELGNLSISRIDGHTFVINDGDFISNISRISFNMVTEVYCLNRRPLIQNWKTGAYTADNIAKKTEHDWKMVYLARREGSAAHSVGYISWRFDLSHLKDWTSFSVLMTAMSTDDGVIQMFLSLEGLDGTEFGVTPNEEFTIKREDIKCFDNISSEVKCIFIMTVKLTGGSLAGNLCWQKAQLFRQSFLKEADKDSFVITVTR